MMAEAAVYRCADNMTCLLTSYISSQETGLVNQPQPNVLLRPCSYRSISFTRLH